MPARWIIGLASGSTADGVDAALLEVEGVGLDLRLRQIAGLHQPYSAEMRDLIRQVSVQGEARQVSLLHRLLGETFAGAARSLADSASLELQKVQCVGCSGHTIGHEPEGRFPASLSLGMPAVIAERCGLTVVSDFRTRDLAAGGQGAALAALPDYLLFRHPREGRLLVHLGGLSRLVYLPPGGKPGDTLALETGPGNLLLDALMRHLTGGREAFDPGGKHAVQGKCIEGMLQQWLAHPCLHRRPPRSIPPHLFADEFAQRAVEQAREHHCTLHDLLCTANHFVARSIALAIARYWPGVNPDRVLLSGGGVRNGMLLNLLQQQFKPLTPGRTDEVGVPGAWRRPMVFALLAALTLDGVAGNIPAATGAAGSRLLGSLTPGSSANWAKCLAWMSSHITHPALAG